MDSKIQKKKSHFQTCFLVIVLLIVLVLLAGFLAVNFYNNAIYSPASDSSELVSLKVSEGDTLTSIAKTLEDKGLIKNSEILKIYLRLNSTSPNIKAGNYSIPKNKTAIEIIEILEDGVLKPGVRVTIKEGSMDVEIGQKITSSLGTDALFNVAEFRDIVVNPDSYTFSVDVQTFLNTYKPSGKPLEGFFYPDTYEFAGDQTTLQIVDRMVQNFIVKVNDNINLNNLNLNQSEVTTLYDALKLASIIEKEAGKDSDRKDISSVFHNRIQNDIPLESDVTVNYVTGQNSDYVSISDTHVDSPYNTYQNLGLTPTPINNPRIESIVAALYPTQTDYFYFLYYDGTTYFSKTFEEHQQKACQYRGC
ncbi:MAG: endolytic transglycosylase MltG [Candidatus Dojkabacteria bacterium]